MALKDWDEETLDDFISKVSLGSKNQQLNQVLYIYQRIIFGLLIQADVLATVDYAEQRQTNDYGLLINCAEWRQTFEHYRITQSIRQAQLQIEQGSFFDDGQDINKLRTQMFLEAEHNLKQEYHLHQLEAPTGAGKTLNSLNLVLTLLEKNRELNQVFYAFPFNTLVEQTYQSIYQIFKGNQTIINQIGIFNSEKAFKHELESEDYRQMYLDYQFLYTSFVISTNVKLFDIFFGNKKTSYYPLPLLANSVIVLDEIQAYKNSIWHEMITMLNCYADILNIKIIIMSATLPDFNYLLADKAEHVVKPINTLLPNAKKYFNDRRFKERVKLDFSLLNNSFSDSQALFSKLIQLINYHQERKLISKHKKNTGVVIKYLVEFISKKTARAFYKFLRSPEISKLYDIRLISGDTSLKSRKDIIDEVKSINEGNCKSIILVCTQTIEAGVDIDMDIGFKDISLLDSEEQFLGRINRNFKATKSQQSIVYFFNYDDASTIYKTDVRVNKHYTLENKKIQSILQDKDFTSYYTEYILKSLLRKNANSSQFSGKKFFEDNLNVFNHKEIADHFKLIRDRQKLTLFIARSTTEPFDFQAHWQEYVELVGNKKLDYAERAIKLIRKRREMAPYIYEVEKHQVIGKKEEIFEFTDYCAGIYYLSSGDWLFEDDVFFPEKIKERANLPDFM